MEARWTQAKEGMADEEMDTVIVDNCELTVLDMKRNKEFRQN